MQRYIYERDLRNSYQSTYRQYHSTQISILKLVHDIRKAMDERKLTVLILFDYSKCFDKLSRHSLIPLLFSLGFDIRICIWFASYLTSRMQSVKREDGTLNDWIETQLPQGSVIVTLLFPLIVLYMLR